MREFINIINESVAAKAPLVNHTSDAQIASEIRQIIKKLQSRPFYLDSFDKEIAQQFAELAKVNLKIQASDAKSEGVEFTIDEQVVREAFENVFAERWSRAVMMMGFFEVAGEASESEESYQQRMAPRDDDLSSMIEDSGFLRGLSAQESLGRFLDIAPNPVDPKNAKSIVDHINRFINEFIDALAVSADQAEQPVMLSTLYQGLGSLLPVLCLIYKNK